jgi:S-adenosylmethionine-diacylglycerol 3-amino-3-carboxypropyl transferase
VAFAQVREDALQDLWLARRQYGQRGEALRIVLTASGGCTAATLASFEGTGLLHLVDANSAQLALTRLKVNLLRTTDPGERLRLLGHVPMPVPERRRRLSALLDAAGDPADALGPVHEVAAAGPDHCGRYELLFAALREELGPWRAEVEGLLALRDPVEQAHRVGPETLLGRALDRAFDLAFDLDTLVCLFGAGATANRVEPFARHFAGRTRHVLAAMPAADNPYLWQLLAGRYPPGVTAPWLAQPVLTGSVPEVSWVQDTMDHALAAAPADSFDIVHLSNILDWLSRDQARSTLAHAWRALRPGGVVVVRQLNSTLNVRACGAAFIWDPVGDRLHARDRSFFYRALHIGAKPVKP